MLKRNKLSSYEKSWRELRCTLLSERGQSEDILFDFNSMTSWKRQNYRGSGKIHGWQGVEEGGRGRWRSLGAVKVYCVIPLSWICIIMHLSKPIECTPPRANPNVEYRLWVMILCQGWPIDSNKRSTLVGDADNGGGCACVGAGELEEISALYT